jgi:hypothetical protein
MGLNNLDFETVLLSDGILLDHIRYDASDLAIGQTETRGEIVLEFCSLDLVLHVYLLALRDKFPYLLIDYAVAHANSLRKRG